MGFVDCWLATNSGSSGHTYSPGQNALVARWDDTQTQPQRLDYVFLEPGSSGAQCTGMQVLADWTINIAGEVVDLSDHYPLRATISVP